jgi:LAO/AO transport system kinase
VASPTKARSDLDRALTGDVRALARLLSLVEDQAPRMREVIKELLPKTGRARIIGLTGAPGVGKSTMTAALVGAFRAAGHRVAVLAVDPTSPFTGGALLGDRIRMQEHATDEAVFIRSMASRGQLGGLAAATPQAIRVLDAVGFELIIVETVGVGQAEVAIASLADTVVVLLAPGMGDAVQAAKAGILEVADLFVVNKADKPDAQQVVRDLRNMLALGTTEPGGWKPPIITAVASNGPRDEGIAELVTRLDAHWDWLRSSGELRRRRRARAREEITALAFATLRERVTGSADELAARVADGTLDPFQAAEEVLAGQAEGAPAERTGQAERAGHVGHADNRALARQKDLRLYPWVSRLSCHLIPSTGRPGSGRPGSVRRRRWPPSPRSCELSRSCSASSTRCYGPTS